MWHAKAFKIDKKGHPQQGMWKVLKVWDRDGMPQIALGNCSPDRVGCAHNSEDEALECYRKFVAGEAERKFSNLDIRLCESQSCFDNKVQATQLVSVASEAQVSILLCDSCANDGVEVSTHIALKMADWSGSMGS